MSSGRFIKTKEILFDNRGVIHAKDYFIYMYTINVYNDQPVFIGK